MSTPLDLISLTGLTVGKTGKIDLTRVSPTQNPAFTERLPSLVLYNESGVGLRLTGKDSGFAADLPAGGWITFPVPAGESEIDFTVAYVIGNAAVNTLMPTWYDWNEEVPVAALGNSPIQGGSINSNLNTLINNGESTVQTIISDQPAGASSPVLLYQNSGSITVAPKFGGFAQQNEFVITGGVVGQGPYIIQMDNNLINTDGLGNLAALSFQPTGSATPPAISSGGGGNINLQVPSGTNVAQVQLTGIFAVAPITMFAGHQESGHYFTQFVAPSAVVWSFWVTFKCILPTPPSSVTLTGTTTVNCTVAASHITKYGYRLDVTPTGAGTTSVDTDWVTVGN